MGINIDTLCSLAKKIKGNNTVKENPNVTGPIAFLKLYVLLPGTKEL